MGPSRRTPTSRRCLAALARMLDGTAATRRRGSPRGSRREAPTTQPAAGRNQRPARWVAARQLGPCPARHGREPEPAARPGGESLVESRWVKPFAESLLRLKRLHHEACKTLDSLRDALVGAGAWTSTRRPRWPARSVASLECQQFLAQRLVELEMFDRRSSNLAHRLYDEALACRMRPFADGVQAFPRMVRDLARSLGKQVRLEIVGEATQVDRDILAKLDAPLGHLLRNAVDHGIESPDERRAAGKPAEGVVRLEARHSAGALQIIVSDDGRGVDLEKLRETVVERKLDDARGRGSAERSRAARVPVPARLHAEGAP